MSSNALRTFFLQFPFSPTQRLTQRAAQHKLGAETPIRNMCQQRALASCCCFNIRVATDDNQFVTQSRQGRLGCLREKRESELRAQSTIAI